MIDLEQLQDSLAPAVLTVPTKPAHRACLKTVLVEQFSQSPDSSHKAGINSSCRASSSDSSCRAGSNDTTVYSLELAILDALNYFILINLRAVTVYF